MLRLVLRRFCIALSPFAVERITEITVKVVQLVRDFQKICVGSSTQSAVDLGHQDLLLGGVKELYILCKIAVQDFVNIRAIF